MVVFSYFIGVKNFFISFLIKVFMGKNEGLNSDLDFIKEFEELKIKQKLLIESLKNKGETEQSRLFFDINSKLDFLVKIFNEANQHSEPEVEVESPVEVKLDLLLARLNELGEDFEKRFSVLEKKFEKLNEVSKPSVVSGSVVGGVKPVGEVAPMPSFESKISGATGAGEKKKRKWF